MDNVTMQFIAILLGFLGINFLLYVLNLKREFRFNQAVMPLVAVIYVLVVALLYGRLSNLIERLIANTTVNDYDKAIMFGLAILPYVVFAIIKGFILGVRDPNSGDLPRAFVILNALIVWLTFWLIPMYPWRTIGGYIIMMIVSVILNRVIKWYLDNRRQSGKDGSRVIAQIRDRYYQLPQEPEFVDGQKVYYLLPRFGEVQTYLLDRVTYGQTSTLLAVLDWLLKPIRMITIVFGVLLAWHITHPTDSRFFLYTSIVLIILSEVYGFLSGLIEPRPETVVDTRPEVNPDFNSFFEAAKKRFVGYYFDAQYQEAKASESTDEVTQHYLQTMRDSDQMEEELLGRYFTGVDKPVPAYIDITKKLMAQESVLVFNPFFKDLEDYFVVPFLQHLLDDENVLFITGRYSQEQNVADWIRGMVRKSVGSDDFFKVGSLVDHNPDEQIAIVSASDINNYAMMNDREDFLKKVRLVVLLEPSKLLANNQLGLEVLGNYCAPDKFILAFDRQMDGLLDTLSHTLRVSMTEVSAVQGERNDVYTTYYNVTDSRNMVQSIMPEIVRYLGTGTEVFALALRHHLRQIKWLSDLKFPILDMKWIVGQYYANISEFADTVNSQQIVDHELLAETSLWGIPKEDQQVLIVEDEFNHLVQARQYYLSRARETLSLNILGENYLLRDYFISNLDVFENDSKAIPSIINEYQVSKRNLVIKLLMQLIHYDLPEAAVMREFDDARLPSSADAIIPTFNQLVAEFFEGATDVSLERIYKKEIDYAKSDYVENVYFHLKSSGISNDLRRKLKMTTLLVEERTHNPQFLTAMLFNQVYQNYLPTQYLTFDGKYYLVDHVNREDNMALRRASDQIEKRIYYRQLRDYAVSDLVVGTEMGTSRTYGQLKLIQHTASIDVTTRGYLEMTDYNDLAHAREVLLTNIPVRTYKNKDVLEFVLDGATPATVQLIATVLSEIIHSTMSEMAPYLAVVTTERGLAHLVNATYKLEVARDEGTTQSIFVIEDSEIDLGLIPAISHNFKRYFEIIADYLAWYDESLHGQEPEAEKADAPEIEEVIESDATSDSPSELSFAAETPVEEIESEDEELVDRSQIDTDNQRQPLDKFTHYLRFGYSDDVDDAGLTVAMSDTSDYLAGFGFDHNNLYHSRLAVANRNKFAEGYLPNLPDTLYCAFCHRVIGRDEKFEELADGRLRCPDCSATAIRTTRDFRKLYAETAEQLQNIFGITIKQLPKAKVVNAQRLAKIVNKPFNLNGRTIGLAINSVNGKHLFFETGMPKSAAQSVIAHELTHIWQFENWPDGEAERIYPSEPLIPYEGMAVWVQIQYMYAIGETEYAERDEIIMGIRDDEYGHGFERYAKKYRLDNRPAGNNFRSPFLSNGKVPRV
jgi:hypothetical protein